MKICQTALPCVLCSVVLLKEIRLTVRLVSALIKRRVFLDARRIYL
jgi:hypothetical protein